MSGRRRPTSGPLGEYVEGFLVELSDLGYAQRSREAQLRLLRLLRHTCAMRMLASGIASTTIALWLGHESPTSTNAYLHADMDIKQRALDRTTPPNAIAGRYQPGDRLLTFLEAL